MDAKSRLERAAELLEAERAVHPRSMEFQGWVWAGSAAGYLGEAVEALRAAAESIDSALIRVDTNSLDGQRLPNVAEAREHIQAVRSLLSSSVG